MNFAEFHPSHFQWRLDDRVATITLNRPERKNPLTFDSYAELGETFRDLADSDEVGAVVITGAAGNFCSGGDVHDIIAALVESDMKDLLAFTRMTGELIKAIRTCPQPVIAAIDGICAGAGACIAMAADLRHGTTRARVAFLFTRVGLAGCDMGACAMLPRLIGQGRATELLFTGRTLDAAEGLHWGFFNRLVEADSLHTETAALAATLASGPSFAHGMTKTMLNQEWNMSLEQFIEAEAQAQALCMQTQDFRRAYLAFTEKRKAVFRGD
jgi:enoyl-CoA hydratase/carnithine racemase